MSWSRMGLLSAWCLAGLSLLASAHAWRHAVPPVGTAGGPQVRWRTQAPLRPTVDTLALAAAAETLRVRDPFRWSRTPSAVRFDPWAPPNTSALSGPPTVAPKPSLAVTGIVGGPPWTALVEGIPTREGGVLLQVGDLVGGIRLQAIRGDTVRLRGFDTTWVLTPKRAWQ